MTQTRRSCPQLWHYVFNLTLFINLLGMASTNSSLDLDGVLSPSDLETFEEERLKSASPQAHVQPIGRFLEELAQSPFPDSPLQTPSGDQSRLPCDPECHRPYLNQFQQLAQQPNGLHLQRQLRSPGYLLRTRKSAEDDSDIDEGDDVFNRPERSEKYLFRVRKDLPSQVRNRKGGYLFRTRKDLTNKRGEYLFRTRKTMMDFGKRQAGYLFRTRKSSPSADMLEPISLKARKDMYLFRT
ncbi:hypothetical protein TCAL_11858 [Tigriopus californicus]|uniref:Uncharacterized protein n=1 Tax=Tigriopus californicus TaxID=6832 RepID=A0A553PI47_TIGCA|nr:uncharacterized protein LOC131880025 [Tigriopus californicus]TRY77356.1 hypothetical protein TCAL_11858 [Tigriopus californicus]